MAASVNTLLYMPQIKPDVESFASIKVIGIGGGGGNAVSRMVEAGIRGVDFIAVNSDAQDLHHANVPEKIHIGKNITKGLGAGMDPDLGRQAAEENKEDIERVVEGSDMVFITCGLGGGTGTGASPLVAEIAKSSGALTIAVVTKPFSFEGVQRSQIAKEGLEDLQGKVDSLIVIPNDRLLNVIDKKTSLLEAFFMVDDVLRQAVQGIAEIITIPGIINVDFADVKAIMQDTGSALIGIGSASGEERAVKAARAAVNSPLLETSIDGARGILFNISGSEDLTMTEVNKAAKIITESIDPDAKVIFGAVKDDRIKKGTVKVTVIATGFEAPKGARVKEVREIYKVKSSQLRPEKIEITERERESKEEETTSIKKMIGDFEVETKDIYKEEEDEFDIPAFIRKKIKERDTE